MEERREGRIARTEAMGDGRWEMGEKESISGMGWACSALTSTKMKI